ncbi:Cytochrome c oxidase assembly protein [Penicillium sp. DV-2018c]|nr:Cytochrome c oxidase assembly protein [Penicillium sp. DV-2018c]KAJ5575745.1 Cytochrome c oxidase assembly protein [Penicillium sp. DV-2018c]
MPSSCNDIRKLSSSESHRDLMERHAPGPTGPFPAALHCSAPTQANHSLILGRALAQCLQESDCIMVQRHSPRECLSSPLAEELPTKCQQLRKGFGECKRGLIDMRKRFRGNQPISVSKEMEGGQSGNASGGQLYAGKPAYQTVKELSGDEVQMDPEKTRGL